MNQEPPAELAAIVAKNAEINVRKRMQKLCDTILADATGLPVQSDLDIKLSTLITRQLVPLRLLARSIVRTLDPDDDLICLRIGSDTKEYFMMSDVQFLLVAIQKIDSSGKDVTFKSGYTPDSPRLYG